MNLTVSTAKDICTAVGTTLLVLFNTSRFTREQLLWTFNNHARFQWRTCKGHFLIGHKSIAYRVSSASFCKTEQNANMNVDSEKKKKKKITLRWIYSKAKEGRLIKYIIIQKVSSYPFSDVHCSDTTQRYAEFPGCFEKLTSVLFTWLTTVLQLFVFRYVNLIATRRSTNKTKNITLTHCMVWRCRSTNTWLDCSHKCCWL